MYLCHNFLCIVTFQLNLSSRNESQRLQPITERMIHRDHQIALQLQNRRVAANEKLRLEGEVKILKEKYKDSEAARERDVKINKEWRHKRGKENRKLTTDLVACWVKSKTNYNQGNIWQNSAK